MPNIYEVQFLDRKASGLVPWRYSGSDYHDNPKYFGSSCHPDFKRDLSNSDCVRKIILERFDRKVTPQELRNLESKIQVAGNHAGNIEYYNLTNYSLPDPSNPLTRLKISESIKKLGTCPYSSKTHSKESLDKAKQTKRNSILQWWHCPITLDYLMIKTSRDKIPEGWVRGRKPKMILSPKTRHEIECNTYNWKVYMNKKLIWSGQNLSNWCKDNSMPGLKHNRCGYNRKSYDSKIISKSGNGTVIYDGKDTNLTQKDFATSMSLSQTTICKSIKTGALRNYKIDFFEAVKGKKI